MKKTLINFLRFCGRTGLVIIPFIILVSCSEDFNVNAPYENEYVLNCILRNDSDIQYAVISQNKITENGIAPTTNITEQYIQGADIKIFYNDSVFVMRDTTILLNDSGNFIPVNCYYTKKLMIAPDKVITISATLLDGRIIKSTVKVPQIAFSDFSTIFPQAFQSGYATIPNYDWSWVGDGEEVTDIINLPQLVIYYKKSEGGKYISKSITVPLVLYYVSDEQGNLSPVYVDFSFDTFCSTSLKEVNSAMQEISGDDPYKGNYIINKVCFNVISLDPDLSRFYSAYKTYSADFTIKLRQTDYSNIEGGRGIFGAYYIFSQELSINSDYITSFGYKYDPN